MDLHFLAKRLRAPLRSRAYRRAGFRLGVEIIATQFPSHDFDLKGIPGYSRIMVRVGVWDKMVVKITIRERTSMSTRDWFDLAISILMAIGSVIGIVEYIRGKRGMLITAGIVVWFLGMAIERSLPILAPSQADAASVAGNISFIGLALVVVCWIMGRTRKTDS